MPIKKTYIVKAGDRISRIAAVEQVSVQSIIDATPAVFTEFRKQQTNELIAAGTINNGEVLLFIGDVLNIPTGLVDAISKIQTVKADAADDLTIFIDGKKCPLPHNYEDIEYFDACSPSFNIVYPHDPDLKNPAYKVDHLTFKEKGLPEIIIYIGDDPVLTGSIETPSNSITIASSTQTLSGRGNTLLLEKSDMRQSIQKEFIDMKLDEIAKIVCNAYSIELEIGENVEIGEAFPKVERTDTEKPFTLISRLARERESIVSYTGEGKCLIRKYVKTDPVANFSIDQEFIEFLGVQGLTFTFDTRNVFGEYIGKTQDVDNQNLIETVESRILKQQSVKITDYNDADSITLKSMTQWEEQKTIRDFYNNEIPYPAWLNPKSGTRWKTGETISIVAKEAGIPDPVLMLIKEIKRTGTTGDTRIANLKLLPVEVYE